MRPFQIDLLPFLFFFLFQFLLLSASGGIVMVLLCKEFKLCLCLAALFQHFWSHGELLEHLLHLEQLLLELLALGSQCTDQFISLTLIDHCLILDLLCLISIAQGGEGFIVVISSGRDGADHECFTIATQCILKNSSEAGVTIGDNALTFSKCLISKCTNHQT